ncbi:hypothetical protein AK830_g5275 [Neonectria ditissima]|uniref:DEUBAD domain-containing protein n=1 Tax=Neonectria ditissima TaxID=78410 RepID=A0A0P7B4J1_9HYPO|nr:hypothetical protein AK830_g5275 [Neonectria ditissima]
MPHRKSGNESNNDLPSSSPLSSIGEPEMSLGTPTKPPPAELPPVEDIKLSSPSKSKRTPTIAKPKSGRRKVVVRRAAKKPKWDAESILTDPKSPLASADLRTILSNPMTWDVLDKDDKAEILALFPDDQHVLGAGTDEACPDFASLMNDDSFRHDCAAYTENIAQGRHDPEWLASAWAAHERRRAGDFDEHLENKFREDWEAELTPELNAQSGDAVTGDGDVAMEDPEPERGDAPEGEIDVADELQADVVNQSEANVETEVAQKVLPVSRPRRSMRMASGKDKSEDELA